MSRDALERRYHRLLRAYPADYRRARGPEIVGTYLDLAGPDRAWPSLGDAADLLRGGIRQRLRATGATDLIPGVHLAAMLAFCCVVALAAVWAAAEPHRPPTAWGNPIFGPFATLGVAAWAVWLLAAIVAAALPGRPARLTIGLALSATVALVPAAALLNEPRPPLIVLLPQIALGTLALALPNRLSAPARFGPLLLVAATMLVTVSMFPANAPRCFGYRGETATMLLPAAGAILLAVAVLLGVGLKLGGDGRGGWAILVLLTPIGLLAVHPLAVAISPPNADWTALAETTVAVCLLGPVLLAGAVTTRRHLAAERSRTTVCPTCGR